MNKSTDKTQEALKMAMYEPDGMHHNKPHKCKYPKCPYPCPDLPDCRDAEQPAQDDPDLQDKDPELVKKQSMPKIGCVNHDCDKCKAQQQEPVAWAISYDGKTPYSLWTDGDGALLDLEVRRQGGTACKLPLYTSPPASKPLTDEEIAEIAAQGHQRWIEFARAIEAAHGIYAPSELKENE